MRKIISLLAAVAITVCSFSACGDSSSTADSSKAENSSLAETTTTTSQSETETTTTTTAETTTTTTTTTQATTTAPQNQNRVVLDVKNIQQKPELPRGSEITCAAMLLNYYGISVTKMDMLDYLLMGDLPKGGLGGNPAQEYIGNPKLDTGYGCDSSVIAIAIDEYFRKKKINDFNFTEFYEDDLVDLYKEIDKGNPVLIWATVNMNNPVTKAQWTDYSGYPVIWTANEHCLVLIGYDKDKDTAIFSDPLDPKGTVEYPRSVAEKAYNAMSKQALAIYKK